MLKEAEIRPDELMKGQAERLANDVRRLMRHKEQFVAVPCPACDSRLSQPAYAKYELQFVTCAGCQTVYASPRPRPEHMDEYYSHSENYAYWNQYIFPASESARREKIFKPRVRKVLELCQRFGIRQDTLLEVGAGFGTFCQELGSTGAFKRVIGVEPTPELASTCRARGIEVIEKRIEDAELSEQVDVVVSFEVIEHLFSARDFLQKCHRLIRPGGVLMLTCPNVQGFDILTLGEKSSAVDHEHVNLFHPGSLAMLLTACGFEVIERQTPGQLDAELVRKQVLAGQHSLEHEPFLRRVLIEEWERLGEKFQAFLSDNLLSSNMLLVAKKPAHG